MLSRYSMIFFLDFYCPDVGRDNSVVNRVDQSIRNAIHYVTVFTGVISDIFSLANVKFPHFVHLERSNWPTPAVAGFFESIEAYLR